MATHIVAQTDAGTLVVIAAGEIDALIMIVLVLQQNPRRGTYTAMTSIDGNNGGGIGGSESTKSTRKLVSGPGLAISGDWLVDSVTDDLSLWNVLAVI
jgi:hypothetical protein